MTADRRAVRLLIGDALTRLKDVPDGAVHCVVTSPPYWNLRSYLPGLVKLRDDLTESEKEFAKSELARIGIHHTEHVV